MVTLYDRKNTNESLGKNEKNHTTGKTHQRQICKATENMTGCQEDLCVLFVDFQLKWLEIVFQLSLEGRVKRKNSLRNQCVNIAKGERSHRKACDAYSEAHARATVCFLLCAAPLRSMKARTEGPHSPFLVTQQAEHGGLNWKGTGYVPFSGP